MKKTKFIFISALLLLFITPCVSYAAHLNPSDGPYFTDYGGNTAKDAFGWDETPWIHIQFDGSDLNTNKPLVMKWKWWHEDGESVFKLKETFNTLPETGYLDIWNSPDNWNSHRKSGRWFAKVKWNNRSAGNGIKTITTTVITPEPVSSVLFLTGGAVFVIRQRYRSKRKI